MTSVACLVSLITMSTRVELGLNVPNGILLIIFQAFLYAINIFDCRYKLLKFFYPVILPVYGENLWSIEILRMKKITKLREKLGENIFAILVYKKSWLCFLITPLIAGKTFANDNFFLYLMVLNLFVHFSRAFQNPSLQL